MENLNVSPTKDRTQWIQERRGRTGRVTHYFISNGLKTRLHRNKSERKLQMAALESGWEIYYMGLLDFLCYNPKTEEAFFVEVKSACKNSWQSRTLSKHQHIVKKILEKQGIKVIVFQVDKDNPYKIFNPQNLEK